MLGSRVRDWSALQVPGHYIRTALKRQDTVESSGIKHHRTCLHCLSLCLTDCCSASRAFVSLKMVCRSVIHRVASSKPCWAVAELLLTPFASGLISR